MTLRRCARVHGNKNLVCVAVVGGPLALAETHSTLKSGIHNVETANANNDSNDMTQNTTCTCSTAQPTLQHGPA